MGFFAFSLVIIAAFIHASWNLILKKSSGGGITFIWLFTTFSVVLYFPVVLIIIINQKPHFGIQEIFVIAISGLLHLCYMILLQMGYKKGDVSLIYPLARATGPALSTCFAIWLLGERPSIFMIGGGTLIIISIFFITGGVKIFRQNRKTNLYFGLATGGIISFYTIWDGYSVQYLFISPLLYDYFTNLIRSVILFPIAYRKKKECLKNLKENLWPLLGVALLSPLSYILVLTAMQTLPISTVAPARELSVLLVILGGSIFMKEGQLKKRLFWGIWIFIGIVLLTISP